jgi:hypothetical protein
VRACGQGITNPCPQFPLLVFVRPEESEHEFSISDSVSDCGHI